MLAEREVEWAVDYQLSLMRRQERREEERPDLGFDGTGQVQGSIVGQ